MRIVYVTQGYPPERVGGVETYLMRLVQEMTKAHEVFVFSRGLRADKRHGETYEDSRDGAVVTRAFVNLRRVIEFRDVYHRRWLDALFREYLLRLEPDVVHVQHLGGLSLGMIKTAASLGVPVVFTLWDHQPYCPRGQRIRNDNRLCKTIVLDECLECLKPQCAGLPHRASKLAAYLLHKQKGLEQLRAMKEDIQAHFDLVSVFLAPAAFHRDKMVEAGVPAERAKAMAPGLALDYLDLVPARPRGAPVRKFAYLGTLIPSKGVEDLIQAFRRIKVPGCSLHLHGEVVPYHGIADYGERLLELAKGADVRFHGPYQPDQLVEVLSGIDALVAPSRWYESFGITIREAFQARRPVIASDIGAFSEAVDDGVNGLKFAPGDVFELAAAMERLAMEATLADRLAEAGGPVVSLADHAAELERVYLEARS